MKRIQISEIKRTKINTNTKTTHVNVILGAQMESTVAKTFAAALQGRNVRAGSDGCTVPGSKSKCVGAKL